jgi:hypothetical protein
MGRDGSGLGDEREFLTFGGKFMNEELYMFQGSPRNYSRGLHLSYVFHPFERYSRLVISREVGNSTKLYRVLLYSIHDIRLFVILVLF